jgi:hypothetical protein
LHVHLETDPDTFGFQVTPDGLAGITHRATGRRDPADSVGECLQQACASGARHRAFIFWGHGHGVGLVADTTEDRRFVSVRTLTRLVDEVGAEQATGRGSARQNLGFDFIGFDACFMSSLETAIELKAGRKKQSHPTPFLLASPYDVSLEGWHYRALIDRLAQVEMKTLDIGALRTLAAATDADATAVDLNLAERSVETFKAVFGSAKRLLEQSESPGVDALRMHLAIVRAARRNSPHAFPGALDVLQALESVGVSVNRHFRADSQIMNLHNVTMYYPPIGLLEGLASPTIYRELAFAKLSGWNGLLEVLADHLRRIPDLQQFTYTQNE